MPKNNVSDPITDQELRRFALSRGQVLARLWQIANLDAEVTRGSMSAQIKALSMIVAIEGLIPNRLSDRRAVSAQNKSVPPPFPAQIDTAHWRRTQQNEKNVDPSPAQEEAEPQSAPGGAHDSPRPTPEPTLDLSESAFTACPLNPSQTTSLLPRIDIDYFALHARVPFSVPGNPFARRR
jgi:hypothetical protein